MPPYRTWTKRVVLIAAVACLSAAAQAGPKETAREILDATGVRGGLVVHLGCGDPGAPGLTAALRANDSYTVHGLDRDAKNVRAVRAHVQALGVCGKVTADRLTGKRLPLVDNLVNLVVAEDLCGVSMDEVMRVLCPQGVAYVKQGGQWRKTVKPRPAELDEWTHGLHDASNNAVAHDAVVGPPRRLQWVGSPRWSRHHDNMSSVSAVVSSGGRVFYVFDEGARSSIFLPSKWVLIARDAFSGCILWKRSIPKWHVRLWPLKSGPAQLIRRLVAVGETVYVTLGLGQPLTALDAATGKTIRTYKGTRSTEEIIHSDGVLFLVVRSKDVKSGLHVDKYESVPAVRKHKGTWSWQPQPRTIVAVRANTDETVWRTPATVAQSTLAADARSVYFHDGKKVVCLDRAGGKERWQSTPVPRKTRAHSGFMPTLVVHEDVVVFAGGERTMTAVSAKTGRKLWTQEHHRGGHNSPEDLLVVGGLVWSAKIANTGDSGVWTGRDLKTGKIKSEFTPDVKTYWFHHRCHRARATDKYLLPSRTGIEFVDYRKKTWEIHHWVRGACLYGIMPCNGLIYAPQHPCACYPEAKLNGFNALAPAAAGPRIIADTSPRLERGPAYERANRKSSIVNRKSLDWPTYRHDAARSGRTKAAVPAKLKQAWKTDLGGKLSSVVVAGGKLFVASIDTHVVHALDAETGKKLWSYTAGGRVDSPPTIYQGMALFGSADGHVYCLRAADGELVWRFRAAPMDQRMMYFEQIESVWPVHGSVLVHNGVVSFTAGRNMYVDGGVWLYRLEPKTGKVLSTTHMNDRDPATGKSLQVNVKVLNMPVAATDILSSDAERLYMKSQVFDLSGKRGPVGPHSGEPAVQGWTQRGQGAHLFSPTGFLDGTWWHRTYWVFGRSFAGGHAGYSQAGKYAPAGRILVFDDTNVYGYGRKPQYYRWTTPLEHQLFSANKEAPDVPQPAGRRRGAPRKVTRKPATSPRVGIDKSASLDPTGKPLAVEAWVKADAGDGVVVARGGPAYGYVLALRGGRPQFAVRNESKLAAVTAKEKVVGKWVHLAGVLTADKKLQIYVDGKPAGSADAPGLISQDPHQSTEIGEDDGGAVGDYESPFSFTGLIDEVRIYYGKLTADEIAQHAAGKAGKKAGLVLYMSFDKGDAKDESGRGNHGQIEGAKSAEGKIGKALRFAPVRRRAGRNPGAKKPGVKKPAVRKKRPSGGRGGYHVQHHWTKDLPLMVRAMVQAGDTLFIAGPPDLVDEEEANRSLGTKKIQSQLADQDAALMGRKGALLWAVSTKDGSKLGELRLPVPPAWDGMAAARGRLYYSTVDGGVICLSGR